MRTFLDALRISVIGNGFTTRVPIRLAGLWFSLLIMGVFSMGCPNHTPNGQDADVKRDGPETAIGTARIAESDLITKANPRAARAGDWFLDVTASSGVSFRHSSGRQAGAFTMVESFGSGVGLFDYDADGDVDLFCVGGGTISPQLEFTGAPCRLFRNDGEFRFTDVTSGSGLDVPIDYSHGVTVGDVNGDGFPDLFITCYGRSRLFVNVDGQRFEDATSQAKLDVQGWHTAACFADVTADGIADLFVTGYLQWQPDPDELCRDPNSGLRDVCMPGVFPGAPDRLFVGTPEGTFLDATDRAGLLPDGKGLGVVAADFDGNGHLDFYVANDVIRNHLYLGQGEGVFVESAVASGVSGNEFGAPEGSMGVDVGDFNGDGKPDITVTNYEFEENDLYRNEGGGLFSHVTVPMGLAGGCKPFVGFGTLFVDADMDGWLDVLVVNGHVTYRNRQAPYQQPAFLYRNENGTRFRDVSDLAGPWFSVPHSGRGVAVGDLNNDGAADLVISEQEGPVSVLRNLNPPANWIGIRPQGSRSGTDAVGARVRLLDSTKSVERFVKGGGSYLSSSDPRLRFPVLDPMLSQADIEVRWPTGAIEEFRGLSTRAYHVVEEGTGAVSNRAAF